MRKLSQDYLELKWNEYLEAEMRYAVRKQDLARILWLDRAAGYEVDAEFAEANYPELWATAEPEESDMHASLNFTNAQVYAEEYESFLESIGEGPIALTERSLMGEL
jgi:hypothetical protein